MFVWNAQTVFMKFFLMIVALIVVFVAGLGIGFVLGLFAGNSAIGDTILDMLETYQAALNEELGYE